MICRGGALLLPYFQGDMENFKIYSYPHDKTHKNSDNEIITSVKEYICNAKAAISVKRDQFGKPYIVGIDGIYVSVAHDRDLCLVAVAQRNIGIDLERKDRKVKNPVSLAKRYFHRDEIDLLGDAPTQESFTEMWVKKEALSKLIGRGVPCMKDKSILSDDLIFIKIEDYDGYIVYCVMCNK